nr:MAG TPA: hypothetical protein [Caudoviricetes sp.]
MDKILPKKLGLKLRLLIIPFMLLLWHRQMTSAG